MDVRLFPDHRIVLIIRVIGVTQLAVGPELELEELVPELALVAHVIAQVEVVGGHSVRFLRFSMDAGKM